MHRDSHPQLKVVEMIASERFSAESAQHSCTTADFNVVRAYPLTDLAAQPHEIDAIQTSHVRAHFRISLRSKAGGVDYSLLLKAVRDGLVGRAPWVRIAEGQMLDVAFAVKENNDLARDLASALAKEIVAALDQSPDDIFDLAVETVDVAGILSSIGVRRPNLRSVDPSA